MKIDALLTPRQMRVLHLLRDEPGPIHIAAETCTPASLQSMQRRGYVKGTRSGWKITKKGKEVLGV